jgi:uncharacterized Fe-S radical SAM superfamily protein PflX
VKSCARRKIIRKSPNQRSRRCTNKLATLVSNTFEQRKRILSFYLLLTVFDENGLAKKGLLVRHLVMPNLVDEGKTIMKFLADEVSKDTYVNVMEQYRPTFTVGKGERRARHGFTKYEEIDRPVHESEADAVKKFAMEVGLWRFEDNIWLQKPLHLD